MPASEPASDSSVIGTGLEVDVGGRLCGDAVVTVVQTADF